MKTVKFFTLGCKVNQYDTQSIRERFLNRGYREIYDRSAADVYLINTCTVTTIADRKSKNMIRRCIKANPKAHIIVTGCLVDKHVSTLSFIKGPGLIISKRFFPEGISFFYGHTRAFLKVQDGCDNFCSYCKVPLARAKSRSRPVNEVIKEARGLVENGFKEIVLTGVCLGAYGKDLDPRIDLVDVIEELEKIEGLARLRLSSIETWDITGRLTDKLRYSHKVCGHLHIPLQSGDDTILKAMNRKISPGNYLDVINRLKQARPEIAITTDVIVGFPGEKEENFQNTVDLIRQIEPLKVHIFHYSPRPGTAAFYLKSNLHHRETRERIHRLRDIAQDCSLRYRNRFLNKSVRLLIEGYYKRDTRFLEGLSDNYMKILVKADHCSLQNEFITVVSREVKQDFMLAELPPQLH